MTHEPDGLQIRNGDVGFFVKSPYTEDLQFCTIGHKDHTGKILFDQLPASGRFNLRCEVTQREFVVDVKIDLKVQQTIATNPPKQFFEDVDTQRHQQKPKLSQ